MRLFEVQAVDKGLLTLAELRIGDDAIVGVPVSLPPGTLLQDSEGLVWTVLRQVDKRVALNRRARVGLRFSLYLRNG